MRKEIRLLIDEMSAMADIIEAEERSFTEDEIEKWDELDRRLKELYEIKDQSPTRMVRRLGQKLLATVYRFC